MSHKFTPHPTMKVITIKGKKYNMYKASEVGAMLGVHRNTICRFIRKGTIKAVDSNKHGVQPVWWISEKEVERLKRMYAGVSSKA